MHHASAGTRLIALLGDPVGHSLSPLFQNAAFRAAGLDGVYLALTCTEADFPGLLRGVARAGGAGNVTLPHKELAARIADERTAAVTRTGACNTFWYSEGRIWGDNTDVDGFTHAAQVLLAGSITGATVLLLGAGGAARAVLCALVRDGAREVVVLNRTPSRSTAMLRAVEPGSMLACSVGSAAELTGRHFDLVVNATSLGLRPEDPLPLDITRLRVAAALDLVYRPGGTAWVNQLRADGVPAADGMEMLLHQGAAAFQRWWGQEAPLGAMRDALASLR
jgi:shikimate dehydrogenase